MLLQYIFYAGSWVELKNKANTLIAESGLLIRDLANNILIADFPTITIKSIVALNEYLVLINTNDIKIVLKFRDQTKTAIFLKSIHEAKMNHLIKNAEDNNHLNDDNGFNLPTLNDPVVQEFVLMLLFSDDFKLFVNELKVLLNNFKENII